MTRRTMKWITHATANAWGVKVSDLRGGRRTNELCEPRFIAMRLCLQYAMSATGKRFSFNDVGAHFGGRHHTAVIHAERRAKEMISQNPTVNKRYVDLVMAITEDLGPVFVSQRRRPRFPTLERAA